MADEWKSQPTQGHWLEFDPKIRGSMQHEFGGDHRISGADCPTCRKRLLRLLSLDTRDAALGFASSIPFLHLFYCWTCSIPFGVFSYRIERDGSIAILSYEKDYEGAFGPEGPYEDYPEVFPKHSVSLRQLTSTEQDFLKKKGDEDVEIPEEFSYLDDTPHQVGGQPFIFSPQWPITCPSCSSDAPFLAAISDNASGNGFPKGYTSFTGNLGVQVIFHFCTTCSVVSAYHSVD